MALFFIIEFSLHFIIRFSAELRHLERGAEHMAARGRYQFLRRAIHLLYIKGAMERESALLSEALPNAHGSEICLVLCSHLRIIKILDTLQKLFVLFDQYF